MLSISGYPKLTTLELTVENPVRLLWAATFICSIPPANAIQTIRLNLRFVFGFGGRTTTAALRDIGAFIDRPGALPHLQGVEIEIQSDNRQDSIQTLRTKVLGALASSRAGNLLYVEMFQGKLRFKCDLLWFTSFIQIYRTNIKHRTFGHGLPRSLTIFLLHIYHREAWFHSTSYPHFVHSAHRALIPSPCSDLQLEGPSS